MKKLTRKMLINHLQKSDKEDLIMEIISLFGKFDNVKDFYKAELSLGDSPLLETYKNKITKAYSSANPSERRTNMNVNKLISNFKKVCIHQDELIEILFHRTECGVNAVKGNNKRSKTFYQSLLNSFSEAIEIIIENNSYERYQTTIKKIMEYSRYGNENFQEKMRDLIVYL